MERYNITVKDNPFDGCPYADMVVSDDGAYVRYDDAQRALDAERERLKVQIDYSIQLQRLIESLMYDDTPSPDLYPHTIIVDFKRQLATLQAQLAEIEQILCIESGKTTVDKVRDLHHSFKQVWNSYQSAVNELFDTQAQLRQVEGERQALRQLVEALPHTDLCAVHQDLLDGGPGDCNCFKSRATLTPAGSGAGGNR